MQPILFLLAGAHHNMASGQRRGVPPPVIGRLPLPATYLTISGTTKDSTGAALGSCAVDLFRTEDNFCIDATTSDASTGAYEFRSASLATNHYAVAYKTGSPDVAGTTANTLIGV